MAATEVTEFPSLAASALRALGTGAKRPGAVRELPRTELALPRVTLDGGHVAAYARICGFAADGTVPLIYPQLLAFPLASAFMLSDACPWPALGVVHLANRITQHEPLHIGQTVRVELETGGLFAHEKGQVFELQLRVRRGADCVWEATQTLLRMGVANPSAAVYQSQLATDVPLSCQTEFFAAADMGRRYGAISGDRNPIHLAAWTARLFGFKRAIAHGMWTQARALACLLPPEPLHAACLETEFKTPLFLPGRAKLWSARFATGARFEVRDAQGVKPHLRGQLTY